MATGRKKGNIPKREPQKPKGSRMPKPREPVKHELKRELLHILTISKFKKVERHIDALAHLIEKGRPKDKKKFLEKYINGIKSMLDRGEKNKTLEAIRKEAKVLELAKERVEGKKVNHEILRAIEETISSSLKQLERKEPLPEKPAKKSTTPEKVPQKPKKLEGVRAPIPKERSLVPVEKTREEPQKPKKSRAQVEKDKKALRDLLIEIKGDITKLNARGKQTLKRVRDTLTEREFKKYMKNVREEIKTQLERIESDTSQMREEMQSDIETRDRFRERTLRYLEKLKDALDKTQGNYEALPKEIKQLITDFREITDKESFKAILKETIESTNIENKQEIYERIEKITERNYEDIEKISDNITLLVKEIESKNITDDRVYESLFREIEKLEEISTTAPKKLMEDLVGRFDHVIRMLRTKPSKKDLEKKLEEKLEKYTQELASKSDIHNLEESIKRYIDESMGERTNAPGDDPDSPPGGEEGPNTPDEEDPNAPDSDSDSPPGEDGENGESEGSDNDKEEKETFGSKAKKAFGSTFGAASGLGIVLIVLVGLGLLLNSLIGGSSGTTRITQIPVAPVISEGASTASTGLGSIFGGSINPLIIILVLLGLFLLFPKK